MEKEKVKKTEPKVVVFGTEMGDQQDDCCKEDRFRHHFHFNHHRHGSFTWGLILVLIGFLFLFSNFGVVPPVVWSQVARLWPILLILIGLDTLMGHSEIADLVSSLVGLFIFLTIFGVVLSIVSPQLLNGLPFGIQNYFHTISSFIQQIPQK